MKFFYKLKILQQITFLSENTTSSQVDLVSLIDEIKVLQRRSGCSVPLLVDENIHYRLMKLMYGSSCSAYDFGQWMCSLPVIYGIWHPYKYCLTAVYRMFFPIFAQLETTAPEEGKLLCGKRKVLHIEKMCAVLLLLRHKISERAKKSLILGEASSSNDRHRVENNTGFLRNFDLVLFSTTVHGWKG